MLSTYYNTLQFSRVEDINDFFRANLPEMPKVKAILDQAKNLFNLPPDCVELLVSQGDRIYKYNLLTSGANKYPFGNLVYCPFKKQLDLYTAEAGYPIAQWENKKLVHQGYSLLFQKAGADKLFSKLVNAAF